MRVVLPLFALFLLAGLAAADEVYVPDNQPATGSTNVIPWQPSFMQFDCRYQVLYLASYLGTSGFTINDIAFATHWTGDFKSPQLQIRISHCST